MKIQNPIGILDSGVGGLIIAKELNVQMPNEKFIYFGDIKNMPYGDKSKDFIVKNSINIIYFLYKKKCKALIIACNSITSNALEEILIEFNNKILIFNVIDPIIKNNLFLLSKKIGIIATPATIRSNFYVKKIKKYYNHLDLIQVSIPLLAYFIENNFNPYWINNYVIKNCLNYLKSIDTLILACTHYLFIKRDIEEFYNGKVNLIDIKKIVVEEIKKKLKKRKLLCFNKKHNNTPIFYTSSKFYNFFQNKVNILFGKNYYIKEVYI